MVGRADTRQFVPTSIGSAFDAYAKSALHEAIFGKGADPQFEFDAIFTDQVEEHNRDWAREHGKYVFDCYVHTGAYNELLAMLLNSREEPRFEFTVKGVIRDRVPFLGKPDCRFVHECGVHVILDWKVKGYCSKYGASPSKNYILCRDGYDAVKLGVGATKKNPKGKQSASHGKAHKNFEPFDHHGMTIHAGSMEYSNPEYADQLAIRDPQASWFPERNRGLLKYKPFNDAEAIITELASHSRPYAISGDGTFAGQQYHRTPNHVSGISNDQTSLLRGSA